MNTVIKEENTVEDSLLVLSGTSTDAKEEFILGYISIPTITNTEVTEEESEPVISQSSIAIKEECIVDESEHNGADVQTASTEEVFLNEPVNEEYIDERFPLAENTDVNEEDCIVGCYSEGDMTVKEFKFNSSDAVPVMHVKGYFCNVCGKGFNRLRSLTRHKKIHTDIKKKYQCDICKKQFSQSNNLSRHKILHSDIKEKFQCHVCNKAFTRLDYLSSHKVVHSSIKKYKCDLCNKAFSWPGCLRRHKEIHLGI